MYFVGTDPYFRNGKAIDFKRIGTTTTVFETLIDVKQLDATYEEVNTVRYEILTGEEATEKFGSKTPLLAGVYQ